MGKRSGDHFGKGRGKKFFKSNKSWKGRTEVSNETRNCLMENNIGVTEYINKDIEGFIGCIKSRFSDFQVNEIDLDDNIVKLTDLSVPKQPVTVGSDSVENLEKTLEMIGQDAWDKIRNIIDLKDVSQTVEIDVTNLDKEKRKLIHDTVKANYGQTIIGTTLTIEDKKIIKFSLPVKKDQFNRLQWNWPHPFVHFLVYKENVDTIKIASTISNFLRCRSSMVAYCGTKDKRAKTTQWFSIKRRHPYEIAKIRSNYCKIGNFTFKPETLKLGMLKGNRFRIALRNVTADEPLIVKSLENLKENGFINYYGLQRFGNNADVPTYEIGKALLKSDFKLACELILKPRTGELSYMKEIRENWWTHRDAKKALSMFNSLKRCEAKLLEGFVKNGPNDYINSLQNIPRNMRLLYIHSYQSLIWNEIVSKRINEYGFKIMPGDLVYVDNQGETVAYDQSILLDNIDDDNTEVICDEDDDDNGVIDDENKNETSNNDGEQSRFKNMVKSLTECDINTGKYTIYDIVFPLPGYDITYPSNICKQWYEDRLNEDNLSSEKLKQKQKAYSLCGAYRKMLNKLTNFSWNFMKYKEPTDTLIQSDIEALENQPEPQNNEDGQYKALLLDFCLTSASYATMALRELMKCDTSTAYQMQLSK